MLLVLVLEFESRRGEILNLFAKVEKGSTHESAYYYSVGSHNSTRADEGRSNCSFLTIKMQGTNGSGEGEEEPAI